MRNFKQHVPVQRRNEFPGAGRTEIRFPEDGAGRGHAEL